MSNVFNTIEDYSRVRAAALTMANDYRMRRMTPAQLDRVVVVEQNFSASLGFSYIQNVFRSYNDNVVVVAYEPDGNGYDETFEIEVDPSLFYEYVTDVD